MASPTPTSALLRIPPELRDEVYRLVLDITSPRPTRITLPHAIKHQALAQVNRQLRGEVLSFFNDVFTILIDALDALEGFRDIVHASTGDLTCFWQLQRLAFCFPCGGLPPVPLDHTVAIQISSKGTSYAVDILHGVMTNAPHARPVLRIHEEDPWMQEVEYAFDRGESSMYSIRVDQPCTARLDLKCLQVHAGMMIRRWEGKFVSVEKILVVCRLLGRRELRRPRPRPSSPRRLGRV